MKITRITPPPPPPSIRMEFTQDEGWAVLAAITTWAERHPMADGVEKWKSWAADLDKTLRRS